VRKPTMTRPAALQRTPDGAAELGCALTPSGPLPSRGLHAQAPRRSLHRGDSTGTALASTANTARRLRAEHRDKAGAGIEPARPWQSLRGELLAQFNITGCCARCRQSLAKARFVSATRATPVMSCAPLRLRGASARSTEPMPRQYRGSCAPGVPAAQVTRSGAASGAVMKLAPARPPSAPRGGSLALSTVLAQRSAVLAASRVRFAASRP
jgi:hypothetical protein